MTVSSSGSIRVGILGTGAICQLAHLPILNEREDVDVVAVSDPDDLRARTVAARFGVPQVVGESELLSHPDIDAVVILTPNHLHQKQTMATLESGKHVLVERPLALTGVGAEEIIQTSARVGKRVIVGMSHRFRPDAGALRSFVASGELGEIYAVRGSWLNRRLGHKATWRQRREEAGGGALMDLGVQALDLCLWLVGYPRVSRVMAVTHEGDFEVEDSATVILVTDNGITVTAEVSTNHFSDQDRYLYRVMGRRGSGSLPDLVVHKRIGGRPLDATPAQPTPQGGENLYTNSYRRQLDRFVRVVAGEAEAKPPSEQIQLMTLIQAAYHSARKGGEVIL